MDLTLDTTIGNNCVEKKKHCENYESGCARSYKSTTRTKKNNVPYNYTCKIEIWKIKNNAFEKLENLT